LIVLNLPALINSKDAVALFKITQAMLHFNQVFTVHLLALHVEEG
jgi:hypothetical protein